MLQHVTRTTATTRSGWIPSEYPNPIRDPIACHIANFLGVNPSDDMEQGVQIQQDARSRVLFCDPDGILTNEGVGRLADMLRNFTSTRFGREEDRGTLPCRKLINGGGGGGDNIGPRWHDPPSIHAWDSEANSMSPARVSSILGASFPFRTNPMATIHPEIAVAIVSKMDLQDILHEFSFYTFEDEEDMINDAAQYFASYLHNAWFGRDRSSDTYDHAGCHDRDYYLRSEANGILLFISIAERVCFISSGNGVATVLPWWRLEWVVSSMKDDMRRGDYYHAISNAIHDITFLLEEGPPTMSEKTMDFLRRFGVVLLFSSITFFLAICGEYRDRKKRCQEAERLSEMDDVERDKARILQREFKTDSCPICLESFHHVKDWDRGLDRGMKRVDSYGIPLKGNDGKDLKILRCGHVFDYTCWRCWITSSSCSDPGICPVCRADIVKVRHESGHGIRGHDTSNSNGGDRTTDNSYGTFGDRERGNTLLHRYMLPNIQSGRADTADASDEEDPSMAPLNI